MPQPFKNTPNYQHEFFISLALAIIATLFLEHSPLDVWISQQFYLGNGHWDIERGSFFPDLIFYTGIKRLLIIFEVYIILAWLQRLLQLKQPTHSLARPLAVFRPVQRFSRLELGFLPGVWITPSSPWPPLMSVVAGWVPWGL